MIIFGLNYKFKSLNEDLEPLERETREQLFDRMGNTQKCNAEIRRLARNTLKKAKRSKKCSLCDAASNLEVAHLIPLEEISPTAPIDIFNSESLLHFMCKICHARIDFPDLPGGVKKKLFQIEDNLGFVYFPKNDGDFYVLFGWNGTSLLRGKYHQDTYNVWLNITMANQTRSMPNVNLLIKPGAIISQELRFYPHKDSDFYWVE